MMQAIMPPLTAVEMWQVNCSQLTSKPTHGSRLSPAAEQIQHAVPVCGEASNQAEAPEMKKEERAV
jgi:hypothetical protein